MKPAKLDPRRSRKLTSRECASVLGGFLGGMATSDLLGVSKTRSALELYVNSDSPWEAIRKQADLGSGKTGDAIEASRSLQGQSYPNADRVFWRGLGATVAGLRVLASERAVKTALRWIYEQDGFWPEETAPVADLDHDSESMRS